MVFNWLMAIIMTLGTVCGIANMTSKEGFWNKFFYMLIASSEFFVAVMYIFKIMFTLLGGN